MDRPVVNVGHRNESAALLSRDGRRDFSFPMYVAMFRRAFGWKKAARFVGQRAKKRPRTDVRALGFYIFPLSTRLVNPGRPISPHSTAHLLPYGFS